MIGLAAATVGLTSEAAQHLEVTTIMHHYFIILILGQVLLLPINNLFQGFFLFCWLLTIGVGRFEPGYAIGAELK